MNKVCLVSHLKIIHIVKYAKYFKVQIIKLVSNRQKIEMLIPMEEIGSISETKRTFVTFALVSVFA